MHNYVIMFCVVAIKHNYVAITLFKIVAHMFAIMETVYNIMCCVILCHCEDLQLQVQMARKETSHNST